MGFLHSSLARKLILVFLIAIHDDTEQVADLTRQLQAEKDACAKMRESLIYGSAGDPMADAEMARLLAERNNLQKQVALLKARIDKSADESRKEQHVSAQLRERIQELENTVQSHVPKSGHESMAVTAKGGEHAGDDVQALKTDLAESRTRSAHCRAETRTAQTKWHA